MTAVDWEQLVWAEPVGWVARKGDVSLIVVSDSFVDACKQARMVLGDFDSIKLSDGSRYEFELK
jgi:hypothetical protein